MLSPVERTAEGGCFSNEFAAGPSVLKGLLRNQFETHFFATVELFLLNYSPLHLSLLSAVGCSHCNVPLVAFTDCHCLNTGMKRCSGQNRKPFLLQTPAL